MWFGRVYTRHPVDGSENEKQGRDDATPRNATMKRARESVKMRKGERERTVARVSTTEIKSITRENESGTRTDAHKVGRYRCERGREKHTKKKTASKYTKGPRINAPAPRSHTHTRGATRGMRGRD